MKGSFACTCTADFAGDSCDLELNACFTREEPCNETGTAMCENLDPFTSNSPFECVCKPGLGINIIYFDKQPKQQLIVDYFHNP